MSKDPSTEEMIEQIRVYTASSNPPNLLKAENTKTAVLVREPFAEGQPAMALGNLDKAEYLISETWVDLSDWPEFDT